MGWSCGKYRSLGPSLLGDGATNKLPRQVWYESTATEGGAFERPKHGTMRRAWLGSVGAGSMRWPGGRARARERSGGGVHGELLWHRVFLGRALAGGAGACGKNKTCCKGVESPTVTSYDTWEEALPIVNSAFPKSGVHHRGSLVTTWIFENRERGESWCASGSDSERAACTGMHRRVHSARGRVAALVKKTLERS